MAPDPASTPGPADAAQAAEVRRRELVLLMVLASVQFTSIVDFMVVMPLGPELREKLAISPEQFSWIVASYTVAAGCAGLVGSSIMDRFGRKSAYLTLYVGFLVGTLCCGLSRSYGTLMLARSFTGAFGGILAGLSLAIIADVFPEERRGRATGILMSAFALASVVGVPTGIFLGYRYGWHVPFLVLAALGAPVFFIALRALPPLREHLHRAQHAHPVIQILEMFAHSNHQRAFALTVAVMLGSFSVIPFISMYLVGNVGVRKDQLPVVFVTGGLLTLVGAPLIGRLADHLGKLPVYRAVALIAACLIAVVTNLPRVPLAVAAGVVGAFMLSNAGRMTAALSMVTSSVERRRRGGFMSANSAVQHLSSGLGASIGGLIIPDTEGEVIQHFNWVGLIAIAATLVSLSIAGRVRSAQEPSEPSAVPSHKTWDGESGADERDIPSNPVTAETL